DAAGAVSRMVDMGLDPFLVATSVVLVAAQRLLRRLCPACKEPVKIPPERLVSVGFTPEEAAAPELFRAVGCSRCHQAYKGRFAVIETLPVTDRLKQMILGGKSAVDLKRCGLEEGMLTLRRCGVLHAL